MNINRTPFDGFEVHLVAEYADPGSTNFCEPVDTPDEYTNAKEEAVAFMFTVYGHRTWPRYDPDEAGNVMEDGYGTTAISDFLIETNETNLKRAHDEALDLAYALAAGRDIVHDFTPREITS